MGGGKASFFAHRVFSAEGVGGLCTLNPLAAGIYMPPSSIHPPTPRSVFRGGAYKFAPPPLLPFSSQASVLKVPKRGQFHAAIRVTPKRCDVCVCVCARAQGALGRRQYRGETFAMRNR